MTARREAITSVSVARIPKRYALMDKRLIRYGGPRSGIEFCDVYTNSKDIIHVKRYGQSKVFSHFFAQGAVSGELFHTQAAFRSRS